jgi:DNA-directed RNA polymerase subunit RPC12/RpoP
VPLEVRLSKRDKPYVTCNTCGVQIFVRGRVGIGEFKKLTDRASVQGAFERMHEAVRRYRVKCQKCGTPFWIEPQLIVTSTFDGSFKGVRCPQEKCQTVNQWEEVA